MNKINIDTMKERSFEEKLNKYLINRAIEITKIIEKKAKKEKWEECDYISVINLMLINIEKDIIKFIKTGNF